MKFLEKGTVLPGEGEGNTRALADLAMSCFVASMASKTAAIVTREHRSV